MNNAIDSLDLDPIKFKLMDVHDGEGWSREKVEAVEIEYRRFLHLNLTHLADPTKALVPSSDIDEFWHYHILDTRKYAQDCDAVFGQFLHHFPYFGLRGEEDAENLAQAYAATREMYHEAFGEYPPKAETADCQAGCGAVVCTVGSCHGYISPEVRPRLAAVA